MGNPVSLQGMVAFVIQQRRAVCCACWVPLPHCNHICQGSLFNFLAASQNTAEQWTDSLQQEAVCAVSTQQDAQQILGPAILFVATVITMASKTAAVHTPKTQLRCIGMLSAHVTHIFLPPHPHPAACCPSMLTFAPITNSMLLITDRIADHEQQ